jgi:N-acetylneuraminic acid mutarotase
MRSRTGTLFLILIVSIFLLNCGGGGGGGGTPADDNGTGTGDTAALSVSLQQGTYWEFYWTAETTTSSMGNPTIYNTDSGRFTATLGAPVSIQGTQVYPITVTGQTSTVGTNFKPRWTYIGCSKGMLVGSTDGATLTTILDASKASMTGGGFIAQFDSAETIAVKSGNFTGNYNQLSSIIASHSTSKGGCETILGETVCSDTKTTFSETEYYKDGIGPLGLKRDMYFSSCGGSFCSDHWIKNTVELIGSSLNPSDGSIVKQPPWTEVSPLNTPRKNHMSAVYNGKIYVFGGVNSSGTFITSVEIYNPSTDSWSVGASMPVTMINAVAKTVGSKIYLIPTSGTSIRIYDPVGNSWSTGGSMPFNDSSVDGDVWTDATDTYIVNVTPNGTSTNALKVYAYRPSDNNSTFYGTDLTPYTDHRWGAVTIVGNSLYVIGGYRQDLSSAVYGNTLRYDLTTDAWSQSVGVLNVPRYSAKAVTFNGEAVVLGGQDAVKEFRDVEAYSETTHAWRKLPSMLKARKYFAALVLNGKIYAIGGSSGGSTLGNVEVYTP